MGLKLEVGKFYKTRDGRKVGPMSMHPAGDCMRSEEMLRGGLWNFDGSSHYPDMGGSPTLIALWPDAPTGPVRTVTRKEIVPGVYGRIQVDTARDWDKVLIGFDRSHLDDDRIKHGTLMQPMDAKQLRALAETAIALAEALEAH